MRQRCALGIILFAALAGVAPAEARYSGAGGDSDDYDRLRELAQAKGLDVITTAATLTSLEFLDDAGSTLLIATTFSPLPTRQARALQSFLGAGGSAVLVLDRGGDDSLARTHNLRSVDSFVLSDAGPLPPPFVPLTGNLSGRSYSLLGEDPNALRILPGFEGTTLVSTPRRAYLNGDGETVGRENESAEFPVLVEVSLESRGRLVFLADPDVFTNQLLGASEFENADFLGALFDRLLPNGGRVVLDESAHLRGWAERSTAAAVRSALDSLPPGATWGAAALIVLSLAATGLVLRPEGRPSRPAYRIIPRPPGRRHDSPVEGEPT